MSTNIAQTTLSGSINQNATVLNLASVSNISAPVNNFYQKIYVINIGQQKGELMSVLAVNGTQVTVSRLDEFKQSFYTGAIVMISPVPTGGAYSGGEQLGGFYDTNPNGAVVTGTYPANTIITPWLNVVTGEQWVLGLNNVWVPAWNTPGANAGGGIGTLVTAVAGVLPTPTAPIFHVAASGTPAVTGIPVPVGFAGGAITLIPDAAFTWTTGDGSIAVGGTAVQFRSLTFTYDSFAGKWYPSYV